MMRLLHIELLKLRPARYFWILMGLFVVILIGIPIGTYALGSWIVDNIMPGESPLEDILPFYDFADIWQNFTFLYQYATVLLSALVAINIAQEFSLSTARQQVIDGLSRSEFFKGKLYLLIAMAATVALLVAVIGFVFGFMYSPVTELSVVFANFEFVGAYFLHLLQDFLLAMFIAQLIRRTGIAVVVLIFYGWIESFVSALFRFAWDMPLVADLLPNTATKVLISNPFPKYALQKTITSVEPGDLAISLGYIAFWIVVNRWLFLRRDL
jgi:hypothetical protein